MHKYNKYSNMYITCTLQVYVANLGVLSKL